MRTPEGQIKDKVKAYLKEKRAWYFMPVPSGYGIPTLDFIGCYKGKFFAIETKAPGKEPTRRQFNTMMAMQDAGGWVVWSNDWDRLKQAMDLFFV